MNYRQAGRVVALTKRASSAKSLRHIASLMRKRLFGAAGTAAEKMRKRIYGITALPRIPVGKPERFTLDQLNKALRVSDIMKSKQPYFAKSVLRDVRPEQYGTLRKILSSPTASRMDKIMAANPILHPWP